jgi:hypothetical protein
MVRAFAVLVFITSPLLGIAQNRFDRSSGEIFAMASVLGGDDIPGSATSAAGFSLGGAWKPSPEVGVVVDFGRHFVSETHVSFSSVMGGVRLYSGERYRTSGFFHILFGAQRTAYSTEFGPPATWDLMLTPGAGFDIRLTDRIAFRPLQIDLTLSRSPGLLRASSGFVFNFGE